MTKTPRFSIITACKGRLEHLKQSLPAMLAQTDSEVIVVDFSCPEEAASYVEAHFAKARTIRVEGEERFSNWRARNAGASAAKGNYLVFCDADIVLAKGATGTLAKLIGPNSFGYFKNDLSRKVGEEGLAGNQIKGFQVIPRSAFEKRGGYDEFLTGYAAGGDTELEERLRFLQLRPVPLDLEIVERVIAHDDEARMRFHDQPPALSYLVGYLYRWTKVALMGIRKGIELEPEAKARLHEAAQEGALRFLGQNKPGSIKLNAIEEPLNMLRRADGKVPRLRVTINVEVVEDPGAKP